MVPVRVYWAAPLFTFAERFFNRTCALGLRATGFDVWLPQEHEDSDVAGTIFRADKEGIDQSDVVVACLDGSDPDSGTSWECGYAHGKKPVVVFRTDRRLAEGPGLGPCNLMLWQSAGETLDASVFSEECVDELLQVLRRKVLSAVESWKKNES